ncbi:MAG TPA: M48 family metallopeptidase [Jatrophihabitans sp.]|nr:M48 family metallopeptidase [Jatrophihabitans sp.]
MYEQIARNKRRSIAYTVLFVLVWLAIGIAIGLLVAGGTPPTAAARWRDASAGAAFAAVFAFGAVVFALTSGRQLVLSVAGAVPADPREFPQLCDLVEALAIGDGLPVPDVYVVADPSPNAFATGISPDRAAVTVTTVLLAVMDREELEGVLGHELSHIKNYDTRLLLVVTTLIGLAGLLASIAWRAGLFVRPRGRNGEQFTIVVLVAGALLAVVGFVVGPIVRLALSRRRESLADASSVQLTRNPVGLIRALRQLQANDLPLQRMNHATACMCIDDPLQHHRGALQRLFDTHPPIAERIATLELMAQGLSI